METTTYKKKHTYADYLLTPEGAQYELLNGQILHEPDAPYISHQLILKRLLLKVEEFVKQHDCGTVLFAPVDVHFDDENCVQPDLLFVRKEREHIISEKEITGAPDLVVEIVSPGGELKDTVEKKALYEKYGVKEYWVIFPEEKYADVYVLCKDALHASLVNDYELYKKFSKDDTLESPCALPEIKIPLNEIF